MAFKYSGNLRRDYLARDIMLALVGNPAVGPRFCLENDMLELLVDKSIALGDRLISGLYTNVTDQESADSNVLTGFNSPSAIVLDGELSNL